MSSQQYSGTTINELCAKVDTVLEVYGRKSSVHKTDGGEILNRAKLHLCYHEMTAGDVQAWYLMADLQDELSPYTIMDKVRDEAIND